MDQASNNGTGPYFRALTSLEVLEIESYDYQNFKPWNGQNRTRFYKYLTVDGEDVEVRTVAVKSDKQGFRHVKQVAHATVDNSKMWINGCCAYHNISGYVIDWSDEKIGRRYDWYSFRWFMEVYSASGHMWKIRNKPIINAHILNDVPRFKYCSWTDYCGDILDFLKVYVSHPRVELLVKAGLPRLSCKSSFVKRMENNKAFMRFVMDNMEKINEMQYGVDVITMAYFRRITLEDAYRKITDRRYFRNHRIPKEVDASKAREYIMKQNGYILYDYSRYLRDCKAFGMDLSDTKVSFPKCFNDRKAEIDARKSDEARKADARMRRDMDRGIAAMAVTAKRLETLQGPFAVVLPKSRGALKQEGTRMKHCVGSARYAEQIVNREILIAFIRRKRSRSSSYVTVSFDLKEKKVLQCYARQNSKPEKRVLDFVNGPFSRAAKRIRVEAAL